MAIDTKVIIDNFNIVSWLRLFIYKERVVGEFSKETANAFLLEVAKIDKEIFENPHKDVTPMIGQILEDLKEFSNSETNASRFSLTTESHLIEYLSKLDDTKMEKIKKDKDEFEAESDFIKDIRAANDLLEDWK